MSGSLGPWATTVRGGYPRLSTFWRQRLVTLPELARSSAFLSRARRMALVVLAIGLLGVPTFRALTVSAHGNEARPTAANDVSEQGDGIFLSARGRVVDSAGQPIVGATVYLREWSSKTANENGYDPRVNDVLATTTTDGQGRFAFANVGARPLGVWKGWLPWDVIAVSKGRGMEWQHLPAPRVSSDLTLQLSQEAAVTGRIVDSSGGPIAGADVRVDQIDAIGSEHHLGQYNDPRRLELWRSRLAPVATTDADGRVCLGGLPPDVRLWLTVDHPHYAIGYFFAATTAKPQADLLPNFEPVEWWGAPTGPQKVFSNHFAGVLVPPTTPSIAGQVTLAKTGEPSAGCKILAVPTRDPESGQRNCDFAATDVAGRFLLRRILPGPYRLQIAPANAECLGREMEVIVPTGNRPLDLNVKLSPGIVVSGEVVEELRGAGVAGLRVMLEERLPWPPSALEISRDRAMMAITDRDGRFCLAVPAGKGRLAIFDPLPPTGPTSNPVPRLVREVEVALGQPGPHLRFVLPAGPGVPPDIERGTMADDQERIRRTQQQVHPAGISPRDARR